MPARLRGLLGTSQLGEGEGLWLEPCASIHTFFMRYAIDLAFLDGNDRVIYTATIPPWRISPWIRGAHSVLEMAAGALQKSRTRPGDQLIRHEVL